MKIKKILHMTGVRELGSGQRQQLLYESQAAKKLLDVQWDTIAYHSGESIEFFEKKIPGMFDFLIIRNFYFWVMLLKHSKAYDVVLFRHINFDIFALIFAPFIKNKLGVHHAKEVEELLLVRKGWKGKIASKVEKYVGKFAIKYSRGIVGVTKEIALYEKNRIRNINKPVYIYPNGIDFTQQQVIDDKRIANENNIFFMCSYFSEWHGLDLLLQSLKNIKVEQNFYIHLVGNLTHEQIKMIKENPYKDNIIIYGNLNQKNYIEVAEKCDIGLASLALFRQNLKEASTLKVREMLAMGLPVYSTHKDASLYNDFRFFICKEEFCFRDVINFCNINKSISRNEVRETVRERIEKIHIMSNFVKQINH